MNKNILILLLIYTSIKANNEFEYEVIDEFIPKTILSLESDKLFKYHLSCRDERKETNIYLQFITNYAFYYYYPLYLLFYDDFTKINKDKGNYRNYTSIFEIYGYKEKALNNLTCNKDYYFVVYNKNDPLNNNKQFFFQISIVNNETNIFNLSPSLSQFYVLFPREINKTECFFYSFNETKYVLIKYDGLLEIKENGTFIYRNNTLNLFQFKKDLKYYIYHKSEHSIEFQFYNENNFFKYNKEDFPILLNSINQKYYFEINL
jgi:hypothetical protein